MLTYVDALTVHGCGLSAVFHELKKQPSDHSTRPATKVLGSE